MKKRRIWRYVLHTQHELARSAERDEHDHWTGDIWPSNRYASEPSLQVQNRVSRVGLQGRAILILLQDLASQVLVLRGLLSKAVLIRKMLHDRFGHTILAAGLPLAVAEHRVSRSLELSWS